MLSRPSFWLMLLACWGLCMPLYAACRQQYRVPYIPLGYASYTEPSGEPAGYFIDLYREVARRSGCKISLQALPAERLRATMQVNRVPLFAPSAGGNPAGDIKLGRVFIPMGSEPMELIVRKSFAVKRVEELASRQDLVFGLIRGAYYGEWVAQFMTGLSSNQQDLSVDADTVYRKLEAGRIGATFGNAYVYRWYLDKAMDPTSVLIMPLPEAKRTLLGVILNRSGLDADDLILLQRTFEAVRDDGSFRRMMARYLGNELARDRVYSPEKVAR